LRPVAQTRLSWTPDRQLVKIFIAGLGAPCHHLMRLGRPIFSKLADPWINPFGHVLSGPPSVLNVLAPLVAIYELNPIAEKARSMVAMPLSPDDTETTRRELVNRRSSWR